MISIIICSVNSGYFEKLKINVLESVGVDFEIIKINNIVEKLSIAKAYNKGAKMAKFPILVFIHEDILFHSKGWGLILLNLLDSLKNPGVLGIAGSSYLPISPSDWWVSDQRYLHTNFLSNNKEIKDCIGRLKSTGILETKKVFALDGMFLAMNKSVWEEFQFDESLPGFHGYDTSICYRVSQKFQNYFIPDLLIEHFSKGYPNEVWLMNTVSANKSIFSHILDVKKRTFLNKKLEITTYHLFLGQLKKYQPDYQLAVSLSSFYLLKLNTCFISSKSFLIWFYFQFVFLKKLLK